MDLAMESQSMERKCKLEEEDKPRNLMNNLPCDIAEDILSRLPVSSLMQFRYACKSWKTLSYNPNLVKLHFSRTAKNNPCLIFHYNHPSQNQLYFVDFANQEDGERVRKIHTPFSAAMHEFYVIGSCNGLLCLSDTLHIDSMHIYNPFTRDCKELPKPLQFPEKERAAEFGFGFHPMTNEYKVVKISYSRIVTHFHRYRHKFYDSSNSEVQIFRLGGTRWKSIGKAPYQLDPRSTGVQVSGRLNWVSGFGTYSGVNGIIIISFDLSDEEFREVPMPDFGILNWGSYHLAALGGCLCAAVKCSNEKLEIWVMKEYNVKESWVKVFNIGAFSPKLGLKTHKRFRRSTLRRKVVHVLCLLDNGEVLLEYKGGRLVSYNPESEEFKILGFQGMPDWFQTVVHEGSLNWIE